MIGLENILSGGDLRSIGKSNELVSHIHDQKTFDQLFKLLLHKERIIVMRAADAVEKISLQHPEYLKKYKDQVFHLCSIAINKELRWHLALLLPRLVLSKNEKLIAWQLLSGWATDKTNSKIVRVNSLQALSELAENEKRLANELNPILEKLLAKNIPSLNARIKKIRKFLSEME